MSGAGRLTPPKHLTALAGSTYTRPMSEKRVVIELVGRGATAQGALTQLERGEWVDALKRLASIKANPASTEDLSIKKLD